MKTYLRHRIRNVIDVKELIVLEYLDFEGKYKDYVEDHDFWELCYVVSGEITLFLEDVPMQLTKNQLLLIPPNRTHSFLSASGNENRAFVICFDSFSQGLTPISGTVFSPDALQQTCMDRILEECRTTFRMNESGHLEILPAPLFGGQQALMLQLEYLLINLVRRMSVEKNSGIVFFSDEHFYADLVGAITRYLRKNIQRKLSLDEICSRFSYSKSFLSKIFKEQTGQTLIACFNKLKMEEAARLLQETSLSVTAIAGLLGYQDVKYFDAIFKKHNGTTPVAYRTNQINLSYTKENGHEN